MLFTYNLKDKLFNPLEESSFKSLDIKELYLFLKPKIDSLK